MSLKNLRKNTQFIKYLKILHKRTKKVDVVDDFAARNTGVEFVYQPCLRAKSGGGTTPSQEVQKRCASGWTSVSDTGERTTKCSANPTAANNTMPMCDTLEKLSYRNPAGLGSEKNRDIPRVFNAFLDGGGKNSLARILNKSLSSMYKTDKQKYRELNASVKNIRTLMKLNSSGALVTPPTQEFNSLDSEAKKEYILTELDKIKDNLMPKDAQSLDNLKLHVLQELLLKVHAPQQAGTITDSKDRFRKEASSFFELSADDTNRVDLPTDKLLSALPDFFKSIRQSRVFQEAFARAKSKQKGFFEVKVPSDMFQGSRTRGLTSSIVPKFEGIQTELRDYLVANPQTSDQTKDDIDFYGQSLTNLKTLFQHPLFQKDVSDLSQEYESYKQLLPQDQQSITDAKDQSKALKKYMASVFNQHMNDFNTAISKISKIDEFAGFDYVRPKFVEFQASVVKLLNDKTIAAYVPKDTNYPFADVEYDTTDDTSVLRLFSTSVKSGWQANVGSITALVGVKYFGKKASPIMSDHISDYGQYTTNGQYPNNGPRFYEALTSGPTASIPQVPNSFKLSETKFNFREHQNHTLFIRPGMELSTNDIINFNGTAADFRDKYLYFADETETDKFIQTYTTFSSLDDLLTQSAGRNANKLDVENALMVLTAMKLRHAYNSRLDSSVVSKGTNLREMLSSTDPDNKVMAANLLKDLKSGLNYHPDTFDEFLSGMFDEYLETVDLADLVDISQLHAKASGESLSNIPTGSVGSMLLLNFYANLGTFSGDTQFTSLTQSVDGPRNLTQIKEHFKKAEKTSSYANRGLYKQCELNKAQQLGMSVEDYVSRVTSDFLLNPDLVEDLKEFVQSQGHSDFESLTGAEVKSLTQQYTRSLQSEDNTIYIETPVDYKTIVGAYVRGKEISGNYAAVGIKTSPHETAGYAVNLFDDGDKTGYQSREQIFLEYENKIERHHQFVQELLDNHLKDHLKNNPAPTYSEMRKNPLLKQFYKRLLKKTISFADDGIESVVQPCAYKDGTGKITGVGSYERKRACYNGWTSIGTGAHANSCMPSSGSTANFRYPTCPKTGSEPDDSDSTLGDRLAVEVSNNPKFQTDEGFEGLLDAIGANLYKKVLENPSMEKLDDAKAHFMHLQAFQSKLLDQTPLDEINKRIKDIEDFDNYISDIDSEPTPEELERYDTNKYLGYKYETYLDNNDREKKEQKLKIRKEKEKKHRGILAQAIKEGRKDKLYNPKAIDKNFDKGSLEYKYQSSYGDSTLAFNAEDITRRVQIDPKFKHMKALLKDKDIKMVADIDFVINDSHEMPEEPLTRLEKLEAAQVLQKVFEDTIRRVPTGTMLVNTPCDTDGQEAFTQRVNNYRTMGFDFLDEARDNTMTAIKLKDGTIAPINMQNLDNFKETPKPNYETLFDAFYGSSPVTREKSDKALNLGRVNRALKKYYKSLLAKKATQGGSEVL